MVRNPKWGRLRWICVSWILLQVRKAFAAGFRRRFRTFFICLADGGEGVGGSRNCSTTQLQETRQVHDFGGLLCFRPHPPQTPGGWGLFSASLCGPRGDSTFGRKTSMETASIPKSLCPHGHMSTGYMWYMVGAFKTAHNPWNINAKSPPPRNATMDFDVCGWARLSLFHRSNIYARILEMHVIPDLFAVPLFYSDT